MRFKCPCVSLQTNRNTPPNLRKNIRAECFMSVSPACWYMSVYVMGSGKVWAQGPSTTLQRDKTNNTQPRTDRMQTGRHSSYDFSKDNTYPTNKYIYRHPPRSVSNLRDTSNQNSDFSASYGSDTLSNTPFRPCHYQKCVYSFCVCSFLVLSVRNRELRVACQSSFGLLTFNVRVGRND